MNKSITQATQNVLYFHAVLVQAPAVQKIH